MQEQQRKMYNYFHSNEYHNVLSQVDQFLNHHQEYGILFDKVQSIVTDKNVDDSSFTSLVVKSLFTTNVYLKYAFGICIPHNNLAAPIQTQTNDLATGCYLYELEKLALNIMKKAVAIAEEWLKR